MNYKQKESVSLVLVAMVMLVSTFAVLSLKKTVEKEEQEKKEELKLEDNEPPETVVLNLNENETEEKELFEQVEKTKDDTLQESLRKRIELIRIAEEEAERKRLAELKKERDRRRAEREKKERTQVASRGDSYKGKWQTFEATYYGADCYLCSGITAKGIDVRNTIYYQGMRVVAVDPRVIPLGSVVEIQTPYETFTAYAGDTGGAIKNYRVDILVESEAVSAKYGRHNVQLRILSKPKK